MIMDNYELVFSKTKRKMVKRKIKGENKGVDRLVGEETEREVTEAMLKPYIFNPYFRVTEFDTKILNKELPLSRKNRDVAVDVYMEFMDDYLNRIKHGRIPNKSYFLAAPDGYGKKLFAYQVIKECIAHRLEPTPIIPSHDLYSLLDKKDYTTFYEHFKGVDLAIITFGGAPTKTDAVVVQTALEHCERFGIPLMILSRFEPEVFHKRNVMTKHFLGVKVTKKGDFGRTELKGFNREKMTNIRQEMSDSVEGSDNYVEEKRSRRRRT